MTDNVTDPDPHANPDNQTRIRGLGELLDAEWFARSAEPEELEPELERDVEDLEELTAQLQQKLQLDGAPKRPAYEFPDVEVLAWRPGRTQRRDDAPRSDVAGWSDRRVVDYLAEFHRYRRDGVSDHDRDVQREWTARAAGFGHFYGKGRPRLDYEIAELGGRSQWAQLLLAALVDAVVSDWNGMLLSEPDAFKLWGVKHSSFWRAIAWLEEQGLLVRLHRYKDNRKKGGAPVQWITNWYGAGPKLLERLAELRGLHRPDRACEEELVAAEQARERRAVQRRARARLVNSRRLARRGFPVPGRDASPAILDAVAVARRKFREDIAKLRTAEADRRAAGILETGQFEPAPELELELEPPLDVDQVDALEELDATNPTRAELELEAQAAIDVRPLEARPEGADATPGRPPPDPGPLPAPAPLELEHGPAPLTNCRTNLKRNSGFAEIRSRTQGPGSSSSGAGAGSGPGSGGGRPGVASAPGAGSKPRGTPDDVDNPPRAGTAGGGRALAPGRLVFSDSSDDAGPVRSAARDELRRMAACSSNPQLRELLERMAE